MSVRRKRAGATSNDLLLQRLKLCRLAVDHFEHDIARLQLTIRQELGIAEHDDVTPSGDSSVDKAELILSDAPAPAM